jgi:hypothetical protein
MRNTVRKEMVGLRMRETQRGGHTVGDTVGGTSRERGGEGDTVRGRERDGEGGDAPHALAA